MSIIQQTQSLFLLAIPVATVSWTITHEEIFSEVRKFFLKFCKEDRPLLVRKFFFLFTCEFCFSHYVSILAIWVTGFKLLMTGWEGYILGGFALVWIANAYMSLYQLLRLAIKRASMQNEILENKAAEDINKHDDGNPSVEDHAL